MNGNFQVLESVALDGEASLARPTLDMPTQVSLHAPAVEVVTFLSRVAAMTINPCASMEDANERMIASSVRLLFVTDRYYKVMGLVTSRDLIGDRAIKYMQEHGGKREDIMVRDIMTPRHKIQVLKMSDITQARVGDVVETLRRSGRQHALVMENGPEGVTIAGVISTTQVSKQIGEEISITGVASSIADLAARR